MDSPSSPIPRSAELRASWERSRGHGLTPEQPLPDAPIALGDLADRLEENARLLVFSRPVIENLYRQIDSPASTVLLADSHGMILSTIGDPGFLGRAARVALSSGAEWSEAAMGTNAIGTALHTGQLVTVQGSEHYLERNRFLTCVATPILHPAGGIAGILDVSTDSRADISHADALLRTTAELIEHQLIEHLDEGFLTLRFHQHIGLLDSPLEALAVFDEDGRLMASNRSARTLLALHREHPSAAYDDCFATSWSGLLGWTAMRQDAPFPLRTMRGRTFIARARLRASRPAARPPAVALPPASQLDAMLLGDARITRLVEVVRRHAGNSVPLIIEGETGSGKTHLVNALHHDLLAATGTPLVGLDCSTLAGDAEGEAEAFDALRQAAGGNLVLKEIGALSPQLQAKLFDATDRPGAARIIATTTPPVTELAHNGRFDKAGFARRGGCTLSLPPLRERSDFDALVRLFVREACAGRMMHVCPDAIARLRRHAWPGNLRELRNQLRLILALIGDEAGQLCPEDIPNELFDEDVAEPG